MDRITLTGFCPTATNVLSTNVRTMNLRTTAAVISASLATFAAGSGR
jgi:hypothetical protein